MKEQKIKFTPIPSTAEVKAERDRLAYRRRYLRVLRSTVYALLVVAAIAVLLATLFLPVLQVSGDSMYPTLNDKDIILLVKSNHIENGELFVKGMHISPYEKGNIFNKDPLRVRRLLMHKREILHLFGQIKQQGYTLIPLSVYFKGSNIKIQVGLCKGKKLYDKRESAAVRDMNRSIARAVKEREY